jgi:hypothetical protein
MPKSKPTETGYFARTSREPGPGQPGAPALSGNPHPPVADPVLEFLPKIAKQRELAAAADRAWIAAPEDEKKRLGRAFHAAEEKIYELEDEMAEVLATSIAGVIAKLKIPADLYRELAKDSITRGEHFVLLAANRLSEGEPHEAIAWLEPAAKEFRDRAGATSREMPSHEHLVVGALADLRRIAELEPAKIDPVLALVEKRRKAYRRYAALDLPRRSPAQHAAFEAAENEWNKLDNQIARTKATTLAGVIWKLILMEGAGSLDSRLRHGALADLRQLDKVSIARAAALVG